VAEARPARPGRKSPLRWIVAAVVLGGLVVAAVAVLAPADDSAEPMIRGGPLADPGANMAEAALMHVGEEGTYGIETIENHGRQVAVLDRVAFVGLTPGLQILGPLALHVRTRPGRPALVAGLVRAFPPPHQGATLHPVDGFRVRPWRSWKDTAELLIGFRALRKGILGYRALELHYHVGDRRFVTTFHDPLTVCTPYSFPLPRCRAARDQRRPRRVHSPGGGLGARLHDVRPEDPDRVSLRGRVLGGQGRARAAGDSSLRGGGATRAGVAVGVSLPPTGAEVRAAPGAAAEAG
jgi:hypothetical protein